MADTKPAHRVELELAFDEAIERTVHELAERGFGVVTWIDLRDKLIERLGADFRPYVIMGVFNPDLAQRALEAELEIGLVLAVNVIVYETEPGHSVVAASDPERSFSMLGGDPRIQKLARDASARVGAAVRALRPDEP